MLYIGIRLCLSISFVHLDVFILCPVDSITACCTPRLRTSLLRTTTRLVGARLVYYLNIVSLVHIVVNIVVMVCLFIACLC